MIIKPLRKHKRKKVNDFKQQFERAYNYVLQFICKDRIKNLKSYLIFKQIEIPVTTANKQYYVANYINHTLWTYQYNAGLNAEVGGKLLNNGLNPVEQTNEQSENFSFLFVLFFLQFFFSFFYFLFLRLFPNLLNNSWSFITNSIHIFYNYIRLINLVSYAKRLVSKVLASFWHIQSTYKVHTKHKQFY